MIRTFCVIAILIGIVLWTPVWLQLLAFVLAVFLVRYRLLLFVPALVADALYAPTLSHTWTSLIGAHTTVLIVGVFLAIWYIITTQTRIGTYYAISKK